MCWGKWSGVGATQIIGVYLIDCTMYPKYRTRDIYYLPTIYSIITIHQVISPASYHCSIEKASTINFYHFKSNSNQKICSDIPNYVSPTKIMSIEKTTSAMYNIDKLTETNYHTWVEQIEAMLDEKDIWEKNLSSPRKHQTKLSTSIKPTSRKLKRLVLSSSRQLLPPSCPLYQV